MKNHAEADILVFDVGGTHASAAVVNGGTIRGKSNQALDTDGPAEEILGTFEALGKRVVAECALDGHVAGVSFGLPNPFDYEAGISYMKHKYAKLYGCNVRSEMSGRFGVSPEKVTFVNDACAYVLGEVHYGAGAGIERVVGITLGTGVGCGYAVHGRIVTKGEGVPNNGYLWDIPWEGAIVEDFVSTRGIRKLYQELGGRDIEVLEIAERAATDPGAMKTFQMFGKTLGTVLKTVCADFRPDAVVLGGAISRSAQLFLPAAQEELRGSGTRLLVSTLFDDAALLGAAVDWQLSTKS